MPIYVCMQIKTINFDFKDVISEQNPKLKPRVKLKGRKTWPIHHFANAVLIWLSEPHGAWRCSGVSHSLTLFFWPVWYSYLM